MRIDRPQTFARRGDAIALPRGQDYEWHDDESQHHDAALHKISQTDREKSSDDRVGKHNTESEPNAEDVIAHH